MIGFNPGLQLEQLHCSLGDLGALGQQCQLHGIDDGLRRIVGGLSIRQNCLGTGRQTGQGLDAFAELLQESPGLTLRLTYPLSATGVSW